jgi:secreted PhoX family phosphatase
VIAEQNSQDEQQTIVEYTAAQLATGAQTDPIQTLIVADTSVTGALNAPTSITFDGSGNLWVAFSLGSVSNLGGVEMFAAADLDGTGTLTPAPAVTIDSAAFATKNLDLQSLDTPDGLAFDNEGDLWVANQSSTASEQPGRGSLVEFAASQLSASGNPLPERAIVANQHNTNLAVPIYITFGPALP